MNLFNLTADKYECKKCGFVTTLSFITISLKGSNESLDGFYCLKCWAKWIAKNCGKMEIVKDNE